MYCATDRDCAVITLCAQLATVLKILRIFKNFFETILCLSKVFGNLQAIQIEIVYLHRFATNLK